MLPAIEFVRPEEIYATGVGFKRDGGGWQYYLPFNGRRTGPDPKDRYGASEVRFALAISDTRVAVAARHGALALIDLEADAVTHRTTVRSTLDLPFVDGQQISSDGCLLYVRTSRGFHILDAQTLEVVQEWTDIELTPNGWQRCSETYAEAEKQKKFFAGTMEATNISGPVREIGQGTLAAPLASGRDAYGRAKLTGYYVFSIENGAIERHVGALSGISFQAMRIHKEARSAIEGSYNYNLKSPAEFAKVVAREAMLTLTAADDSRDAAIGLVEDLAQRMERDIGALIACETINVRFVVAGREVTNEAFFARFVDERWGEAAPALRRLLTAYLNGIEGGEGCMPWHFQGGGSGFALRALMLLDPDAQDVYRLYLFKGDLEHDHWPYVFHEEEYLKRRGWRHENDLRFSIYLTMSGCLDTDVDPNGPIRAAERLVSAERLAQIIVEEASGHDKGLTEFLTAGDEPGEENKQSDGGQLQHQIEMLANYIGKLDSSRPYARKVIAALPELSFWRTDFDDA